MRGNPAIIIASFFICSLSFQFSFAQQKINYDPQWRKIDSLINKKGLTQSALTEVNKIYISASREKNEAQVIKALLYKINLQQQKEEESEIKNIKEFEKEITTSNEPSRSILKSIVAEWYWYYFQEHRYQLYDRTTTRNFKKEDIATWDIEDFHKKITSLYLESISNEKLLQQTRLEPFDAIIIKGNVRYLRPTLYDLLAHRAIEYFKNDERYLISPEYTYDINDPMAFAEANQFAAHLFVTRDSLSLHHKALLVLQRLISFHLRDEDPSSLIDVDIKRIEFVNRFGMMENKETLYEQALQRLPAKYPNQKDAAQALFLIAQLHEQKANQYDPLKDTSNRFEYVVATQICERVMAQKDSSEGKSNCEILLRQILRKELTLKTEKVNIPAQPFRSLVSLRNISDVYFRLVKIDKLTKESLGNSWQEEYWDRLLKLPYVKTFTQQLPATNDHQLHRLEIKVDALPVGEYALLSSANSAFESTREPLAVQFFFVSNLSYINIGNDVFVLNRDNGQPIPNVNVQLWQRVYDYKQVRYTNEKREKLTTDIHGHVAIPRFAIVRGIHEVHLELTTKDDHLFLDEYGHRYSWNDDLTDQEPSSTVYELANKKSFLFTDRSIYRPGQTVYFKGIVITKDFQTKQPRLITNAKTRLYLMDANGEEIDSMDLTTNEFGSYNGKFKLPENRMNGSFRIVDKEKGWDVMFSVEEYKRPKFFIEYEKQKGSYRINDSLSVNGNAKAYAGSSIGSATVKYRVVRESRFPYQWMLSKMIWPSKTSEQEIAHGELVTDADGKFVIRFAAMPDKTIKKEYKPIFHYKIIADVTDINGETRSAETYIDVSYQALQLSLTISRESMPVDSFRQVLVSTTNLAREFQPSKINLTIWRLYAPARLIRERFWEQPDQFVMSKEEYLQYFPYDEYSDETKKETWTRLTKEYEITDSTKPNSKFTIDNSKFLTGWYVVEVATIDKYGDSLKDMRFLQLTDSKTGEPPTPEYNWTKATTQTKEPGETAKIEIGSSAADVFLIKATDENSESKIGGSRLDYVQLSKEQKVFNIPIKESNRGGIDISFSFVKHNRFYTSSHYIEVPWTNKELNISYETYRDKTLPDTEEKWKIKLSVYKNERVVAEVLAGMYDASLDQFTPQQWEKPGIWPTLSRNKSWQGGYCFESVSSQEKNFDATFGIGYSGYFRKEYDDLIIGIKPIYNADGTFRAITYLTDAARQMRGQPKMITVPDWTKDPDGSKGIMKDEDVMGDWNNKAQMSAPLGIRRELAYNKGNVKNYLDAESERVEEPTKPAAEIPVSIRKNFNETAFFFPELRTDTAGNVEFSFTMPEALTQWKWMTLAHTKDLAFGYSEKNIVTQKELMLQPNLPRFLREGDIMEISTKIVNLADSEVTGQVQLQLIDATTNQSVDGWFQNMYSNQYFTAPAKGSVPAQFSVQIPHLYNKPVIVRLIARAGNVSDGEENVLPVLTNRVLVTETLPLNVRGSGTKEFKLDKLIKSGGSETLQHHALTVEFTSNPAWYAVQALPYLMEFPYECAEQVWNRFYANALATKMVSASPKIKQIFEKWKTVDTTALLSNLQKNQELKSVLLQETPWVMEAKSETEQKKRIAMLFDMVRMSNELGKNLDQLIQMQSPNGGFVWFKGGPDDRYITQYIISGLGHLKILDAIPASLKSKIDEMTKSGINYLDGKIKEDYDRLVKSKVDLTKQQPGYEAIQYLYMRSFFNAQAVSGNIFQAYNYYRKQSQLFWLQQNRYMQGMIALALFRTGDGKTSNDILRSLKQNAIVSEEMGMYWKENSGGYYWHQAPIETQSLLIEAFATIYKDNKIVDDLKTWLLKNKQTNNWNTTKATADACYALLLQGTDWLSNAPVVHIKLGDKSVSSTEQAEAGTGYFKKTFDGPFVNPSMGNISVSVNQPINNSTNPASAKAMAGKATNQQSPTTWGSVYWQYFENAENITASATPLSIVKKVFVERNTDRGPVIEPIGDHASLKVGDKVKIRIELRVDRDMEYVHMKDMRASSFEPVNVLSSYKWQGGLGYYESTKDASTNFFFSNLPKGTYVFEYSLFASQIGTFSNGITSIQCMYAPEFTSHSEGIKVSVEAH